MSPGTEGKRGAKECPVCHVSMEGRDPYGHAQLHFPAETMPIRPENLEARKQYAELVGREIPKE
jgi:hypothetical protein